MSGVLTLLGGFGLTINGQTVDLAPTGRRLLAFLALRRRPVARSTVWGTLWPDCREDRAAANLRGAIWRLPSFGETLVRVARSSIALGDDVRCDVYELEAGSIGSDGAGELLPDWSDDWVMIERERLRHLRLHALEEMSDHLLGIDAGEALAVALRAVELEHLRESSHRRVIAAHLALGNRSEALQHFDSYCDALRDALGIQPSPLLRDLIAREIVR